MMASFFSIFNPISSFPDYTGPYRVGTLDVELPTTQLPSPSPTPDPSISTVSFRIFYPCKQLSTLPSPVYWLPEPQREYFKAYLRFVGASPGLSAIIQYLPFYSILSNIKIPALRDAKILLPPTSSRRWPVMIFAHGLGGSRNAYSHLVGSLASYGVVVIAPDLRDGSAPISIVQNVDGTRSKVVKYRPLPHVHSQEVEDGRDAQMRIRLWELGLIHEALLKIDRGESLTNIAALNQKSAEGDLSMFACMLDVHTPGRISWSGHSFGAATIVQFVKSVFYRSSGPHPSSYKPVFTPSDSSSITRQITPASHLSLLDLWCPPLRSTKTAWLWDKPLPCYTPSGTGGSNLVVILSESFFKWRANLDMIKQVVFPQDPSDALPHVFYRMASAHLSQSDFGLLSPGLTKRFLKADEPIRTLRLNVRAILETMRQNRIEVAPISSTDMEEEAVAQENNAGKKHVSKGQDFKILATDGSVKGWVIVEPPGGGEKDDIGEGMNRKTGEKATPAEAVVDSELIKIQRNVEEKLLKP